MRVFVISLLTMSYIFTSHAAFGYSRVHEVENFLKQIFNEDLTWVYESDDQWSEAFLRVSLNHNIKNPIDDYIEFFMGHNMDRQWSFAFGAIQFLKKNSESEKSQIILAHLAQKSDKFRLLGSGGAGTLPGISVLMHYLLFKSEFTSVRGIAIAHFNKVKLSKPDIFDTNSNTIFTILLDAANQETDPELQQSLQLTIDKWKRFGYRPNLIHAGFLKGFFKTCFQKFWRV